MKTIQARFPGRCIRTGAAIRPGDSIIWHGKGRSELVQGDSVDPSLAYAASIDPELAQSDPDAAAYAGQYLARAMSRGVSDIWHTADGKEYYRNKRGLCEDAPCCGCCNA
jgi:hypothetical protein